jgi:hypothetical protein
VASLRLGLCWLLWVRICMWFVLTPKVFELCTKQLVVSILCRSLWVIDCLSCFIVPSWSSSTPLYPKVLRARQRTSLFFRCFHLIFTFESIKELVGASLWDMWLLKYYGWCMDFYYKFCINGNKHVWEQKLQLNQW